MSVLSLEEEVTFVLNLCLLIKLLEEAAGSLLSTRLELLLIILNNKGSFLGISIDHLEDESTIITLQRISMELTSLCSDNSTRQSRFRRTG